MASKYWIKLYHEILDDPKMGRLDDRRFRRAIEIFLLAGEMDNEGMLPLVDDMAWRLRVAPLELLEDMYALQKVGIVQEVDGVWYVTKFSERQSPVSDAERQRLSRERKQKESYYCHETVTNRNADTDTDTDTETEEESDVEAEKDSPTTDLVFVRYENEIGSITPITSEKIQDLQTVYPEAWILEAIGLAVERNARNLAYIEAILKRWKVEGKDNGKKQGKPKAKPVEQRTAEDYRKAWSNL